MAMRALSSLPQRALVALVRFYQLVLSAWVGGSCRFEPTCSAYSLQALQDHGAAAGTYLTFRRLVRCHPFCAGGHDPVPAQAPTLFRHLGGALARPAATPPPLSSDKISS
jgi:putative membrane protein insertion efficiency factor